MCYAVVNSNYMQNSGPSQEIAFKMSPWRIGLYIADAIIAALAIGGVLWIVFRTQDERKQPQKYAKSKKG